MSQTFGSVTIWGGEDTEANDEICVRALDKFVWCDENAQDEKKILYTYDKLLKM